MSEERYEVIFRGDVLAGQSVVEVKQRLAKLFNADAARIDQMFSGKPVVIKRNLDLVAAERYQSSLMKAGALVDIRPARVEGSPAMQNEPAEAHDNLSQEEVLEDVDFDVAPVGSDVLAPEDKKDFTPVNVDTSSLTISEAGADVLADEEKKTFVERDIDTSGLSVDKSD